MLKCEKCGKEFKDYRGLNGHLAWCGIKPKMLKALKENKKPRKEWTCQNCGKKIISTNHRKFCSLKCNASVNKERRLNSIKYGRTIRELEQYSREHPVCEICGRHETTKANRSNLAYDHSHETGEFRGMLCFKCNTTFDYFVQFHEGFEKYYQKHYGEQV